MGSAEAWSAGIMRLNEIWIGCLGQAGIGVIRYADRGLELT
ncbi:MAG: hypothetical protein ACFCU9_03150 [Cyanophyceae cyanobacterium]